MTATHTLLVTGGAGFIGSACVRYFLQHTPWHVVNLDALTYAGNLHSLGAFRDHARHTFVHGNICDPHCVTQVFANFSPSAVIHCAAESHVDRSIDGPAAFVHTNVVGTQRLLEASLIFWRTRSTAEQNNFRFLHVSTDEVYGSAPTGTRFTEQSPYAPNSPYAASKAASDHLVRAYAQTYGLPTIITHCANNYGPYQFPEKLIPLTCLRALNAEALPLYGTGENIRDWIHVEDHCRALHRLLSDGRIGENYLIGTGEEYSNLFTMQTICQTLDQVAPRPDGQPHASAITYVHDRPGHDARYANDPSKIQRELDWRPQHDFRAGLAATVRWYVENQPWCQSVMADYQRERLGSAE